MGIARSARKEALMLRRMRDVVGYTIGATDGTVGRVEDFLFDDATWTVSFLVVDTSLWLFGRRVLLPPSAVERIDDADGRIVVRLTREQVRRSPDVDVHKPVSRRRELELLDYYRIPPVAAAMGMWGAGFFATSAAAARAFDAARGPDALDEGEEHLRSANEVAGYRIVATDGEIGHVDGFLFDDETWEVRSVVVDTRNWWPGRKALVAPARVDDVNWQAQRVLVALTIRDVESAPVYDPATLARDDRHRGGRRATGSGPAAAPRRRERAGPAPRNTR
jgi:hypothetical protein